MCVGVRDNAYRYYRVEAWKSWKTRRQQAGDQRAVGRLVRTAEENVLHQKLIRVGNKTLKYYWR